METMVPVSDLRFYDRALHDVGEGQHVILTKNGKPKYVITDYNEWKKMNATIELFTALQKGVQSFESEPTLSLDQLKSRMADRLDEQ